MKKFWTNCSELKQMILLAFAIGIVLMLASIVGVVFGQYGWLIGVALGTAVEMANIALLFKGSEMVLKNNSAPLFLITYFGRMLLFVAGIVLLVLLQYQFGVHVFDYSFWGFIIGITPMTIVVIIVMTRSGRNPVDIAEKKEDK